MVIRKEIAPRFDDYIFNWDYETYLLIGGYGSAKSYHTAFKIILKLLEEKRKCLVVRQVFGTIYDSCFSLIKEILSDMNLMVEDVYEYRRSKNKVLCQKSPLRVRFHNGSEILFRGMDDPQKVKSINDVSIVWLEEGTEIIYDGYKELQGRLRTPNKSMHFIITCNPVSRQNWVYKHFFGGIDEDGNEYHIVTDEEFYDKGTMVVNGVYYHHSVPTDNPWLPKQYIKRLDDMRTYDKPLYMVARWGHFGVMGARVLPNLVVSQHDDILDKRVQELGRENMYFGLDFGFETSYNAALCMSVDQKNRMLIVWDEVYMNHITDPDFVKTPGMLFIKEQIEECNRQGYRKMLVADNEDPKAIAYYRQCGYKIRGARNKFAGSRLSNTRKMKRFRKIWVRTNCTNTIRELKELTYAKDSKGEPIYDKFNIDPHTFSAMWYGLDSVTVSDIKGREFYSKKGW